jgi:hypothetical protein
MKRVHQSSVALGSGHWGAFPAATDNEQNEGARFNHCLLLLLSAIFGPSSSLLMKFSCMQREMIRSFPSQKPRPMIKST